MAKRVLALDGLRGVAVLLVFACHLGYKGWPSTPFFDAWRVWSLGTAGGLTGVQLFFALSGYLITNLLLDEREASGHVSLPRFYVRRIRRLYPALIATCVAFMIFAPMLMYLDPSVAVKESLRALSYITNFYAFPESNWLYHTWTLSVEEQFYLVWPVVLLASYRIAGRRGVGIAALALAMATIAARHSMGLSRHVLYDMLRWDAPLLGCALAALRFKPGTTITATAIAVLAYFSVVPMGSPTVSVTATAIASAIIVSGAARLRVLESWPLCHLGRISYGLYLWSCLIIKFGLPGPLNVVLSIGMAELSMRYIEAPFMRGRGRRADAPRGKQSANVSEESAPEPAKAGGLGS